MRRYEVPQGIGKNRKLNHKNPATCRNKIELFKFDCYDKGHGQKQIPENNRSKRQQKQFSLGLSDLTPSVSPIMMKLRILKTVPNTSPLPAGFRPVTIKMSVTTIAVAIALEQYFFCNSLTDSII